jgi:hypothetical protein
MKFTHYLWIQLLFCVNPHLCCGSGFLHVLRSSSATPVSDPRADSLTLPSLSTLWPCVVMSHLPEDTNHFPVRVQSMTDRSSEISVQSISYKRWEKMSQSSSSRSFLSVEIVYFASELLLCRPCMLDTHNTITPTSLTIYLCSLETGEKGTWLMWGCGDAQITAKVKLEIT